MFFVKLEIQGAWPLPFKCFQYVFTILYQYLHLYVTNSSYWYELLLKPLTMRPAYSPMISGLDMILKPKTVIPAINNTEPNNEIPIIIFATIVIDLFDLYMFSFL